MRDENALYVDFSYVITSYRDGKELNKLITTSAPVISKQTPCNCHRIKCPLRSRWALAPGRIVFILLPPEGSWSLHYQLLGHMEKSARSWFKRVLGLTTSIF